MTLNSLGKVYHELGYLTQSQYCLLRSQGIVQKLYCSNPSHPQVRMQLHTHLNKLMHPQTEIVVLREGGPFHKS